MPSSLPWTRRNLEPGALLRNEDVSGALRTQAARSTKRGVDAKPRVRQYCMSSRRKSGLWERAERRVDGVMIGEALGDDGSGASRARGLDSGRAKEGWLVGLVVEGRGGTYGRLCGGCRMGWIG